MSIKEARNKSTKRQLTFVKHSTSFDALSDHGLRALRDAKDS